MSDPLRGPARGEFELAPYSYRDAALLARELDLPEAVAVALVRRGLTTPAEASEFLRADERHDPSAFHGMGEAVATIRKAIADDRRVTVHGDYDVDGVTSTAILVSALRDMGADCDWLIPSRVEDGYGVTAATVEKLAARGTGLMITVDCGITSVEEVAAARAAGIDVVVTDHHQPAETLPDCPIVHPVVSEYPCPDLCAAGVAHKLAGALLGVDVAERDLDLVALATVADMVPLTGENRSLVRRGLELARRSPRLGLRALMRVASVAPERLSEEDMSFRLAPRINAAGRLYRADAAVELFLSGDEARTSDIASELDRANLDRRETEAAVLSEANALFAELERERGEQAAVVLWGQGWHPGVVGICASRMAERHSRPAILIALDETGRGKGSGRSIAGFDLLAGLRACGESLARFGGHRAAAGLEIEAERLEEFRSGFSAHVAEELAGGPQPVVEAVDAVVGVGALGHELASGISRLGPFGVGNPALRLLVPSATIADPRPMGDAGRHARFSLRSGGARASGVGFGVGSTLERLDGPRDVSVRLELNEWNGAVEARPVLGRVFERAAENPEIPGLVAADAQEYAERLEAEMGSSPDFPGVEAELGVARERVDRRAESGVASVAALLSAGEPVLVVTADALWRRQIGTEAACPRRFGGGELVVVSARASLVEGLEAAEKVIAAGCGLVITDWAALALAPGLARRFEHVVSVDPAPHPRLGALAAWAREEGDGGYLHVVSEDSELTVRALNMAVATRDGLAGAFLSLRDVAADDGYLDRAGVRLALAGDGGLGRSPESCARILRIFMEMGVVIPVAGGPPGALEVVSSVQGSLSASESYLAHERANEECVGFLTRPDKPGSSELKVAA